MRSGIAEATTLFAVGRFDDSAALLHGLIDRGSTDTGVVALHERVDAASKRNVALLKQLGRLRAQGKWQGVVNTVALLQQLRPLNANLVAIRSQARAKLALSKRRAAARAAANRASHMTARPSVNTSHANHPGGAPAAGGATGGGTTARPPASAPASVPVPARPNVPNPVTSGGGAAAVQPSMECMDAASRTARHAGEVHAC